jgi:hypothetical protein
MQSTPSRNKKDICEKIAQCAEWIRHNDIVAIQNRFVILITDVVTMFRKQFCSVIIFV